MNQALFVVRALAAMFLLVLAGNAQATMGGPSYNGTSISWGVGNIGANEVCHHKVTVTKPGAAPQVVIDVQDPNTGPGERSVNLPGLVAGTVIKVEVLVYPPKGFAGPPQLITGSHTVP